MKAIYIILVFGQDCDGFTPEQNYSNVYYSKKAAEYFAEKANESSDGLIYTVVNTDDYRKKLLLQEKNILNFEYQMFY